MMVLKKNIQIDLFRLLDLFLFFIIISSSFWVLFFYQWFNPAQWGKTIIFRIVFSIISLFFISQLIFKKIDYSYVFKKINSAAPLFLALLLFIYFSILSVLTSVDIRYSLWGDPLRGGGVVNLIFYVFLALTSFIIIKKEDWKIIFNFAIFTGILVSIVAVFQKFGMFSDFLLFSPDRPASTLGNPNFLAAYLMMLSFISLPFFISSKKTILKIFYSFSFILFVIISVFFTQTRAVLLGLFIGLVFFMLFYPKASKKIKISILIFLFIAILSFKYLNGHFYILDKQPEIIREGLGRVASIIDEPDKIIKSRISAWKISLSALKERPIFGYGPENFEYAFNKYYKSNLPGINAADLGGSQWWDRAHNFILDIALTSGIFVLLAYICFFTALFFFLEKAKRKKTESVIICNGLEAAFIGYLIANFFSFDIFDNYLIFFLMVGYAFFLISEADIKEFNLSVKNRNNNLLHNLPDYFYGHRKIIIGLMAVIVFGFIWIFNIKPLIINRDLNLIYSYLSKAEYQKVPGVITSASKSDSIIGSFSRVSLAEIIQIYINNNPEISPKESLYLSREYLNLLGKNVEANSNHMRDWLLLGEGANFLIAENVKFKKGFSNSEEKNFLKKEAIFYFEKASELSPDRQEIYKEWAKTGLLTGDYQLAEEKAEKCISLNSDYAICNRIKEAALKAFELNPLLKEKK